MTLFRAALLLCVVLLPACGGQQNTGANSAATAKGPLSGKIPDIVDDTNALALGSGWYRYETFGGQAFRWMNNDAQIIVKNPRTNSKGVMIDLQAGPGLGTKNFTLHIRAQNRDVQKVSVSGHQRINVTLPVHPGTDSTFTLHVDGGGKRVSTDARILNVQVFAIANADIVEPGSGFSLGRNWDAVERFAGQTFRWVDNDAVLVVSSHRAQNWNVAIAALPGPGLGGHPLAIDVRNGSGKTITTIRPDKRGNASLTLPLQSGDNSFTLHTNGGGQRAADDPRILNFRVFSIAGR